MPRHLRLYRSAPLQEQPLRPDSSAVVVASVASLFRLMAVGPAASVARPCCLLGSPASLLAGTVISMQTQRRPATAGPLFESTDYRMQPFYHRSGRATIRKIRVALRRFQLGTVSGSRTSIRRCRRAPHQRPHRAPFPYGCAADTARVRARDSLAEASAATRVQVR